MSAVGALLPRPAQDELTLAIIVTSLTASHVQIVLKAHGCTETFSMKTGSSIDGAPYVMHGTADSAAGRVIIGKFCTSKVTQ